MIVVSLAVVSILVLLAFTRYRHHFFPLRVSLPWPKRPRLDPSYYDPVDESLGRCLSPPGHLPDHEAAATVDQKTGHYYSSVYEECQPLDSLTCTTIAIATATTTVSLGKSPAAWSQLVCCPAVRSGRSSLQPFGKTTGGTEPDSVSSSPASRLYSQPRPAVADEIGVSRRDCATPESMLAANRSSRLPADEAVWEDGGSGSSRELSGYWASGMLSQRVRPVRDGAVEQMSSRTVDANRSWSIDSSHTDREVTTPTHFEAWQASINQLVYATTILGTDQQLVDRRPNVCPPPQAWLAETDWPRCISFLPAGQAASCVHSFKKFRPNDSSERPQMPTALVPANLSQQMHNLHSHRAYPEGLPEPSCQATRHTPLWTSDEPVEWIGEAESDREMTKYRSPVWRDGLSLTAHSVITQNGRAVPSRQGQPALSHRSEDLITTPGSCSSAEHVSSIIALLCYMLP
ncbi:unnamed protein product [Protopolystoma xenopodis]|uniref:Uncharacterized protein n=1 Tax=Protopolystoma xenopodis TaxID=117903 RepID=A0A3S5CC31_9PLAT|nr:unnamed protein product [Protopolystoma xenopodis]